MESRRGRGAVERAEVVGCVECQRWRRGRFGMIPRGGLSVCGFGVCLLLCLVAAGRRDAEQGLAFWGSPHSLTAIH